MSYDWVMSISWQVQQIKNPVGRSRRRLVWERIVPHAMSCCLMICCIIAEGCHALRAHVKDRVNGDCGKQ